MKYLNQLLFERAFGNSVGCCVSNRYTPIYNIIVSLRCYLGESQVVVDPYETFGIVFSSSKFRGTTLDIYNAMINFLNIELSPNPASPYTILTHLQRYDLKLFVAIMNGEYKLIAMPTDIAQVPPGIPLESFSNKARVDEGKVTWETYINDKAVSTKGGNPIKIQSLSYSHRQAKGYDNANIYIWDSVGKCLRKVSHAGILLPIDGEKDDLVLSKKTM